MITVANYEELKSLPIPAPQTTPPDPPAPLPEPVFVLGLEKFNDGGEGIFTWDENSTEEDNGGTIIAPDPEVSNGRWKRVIEEKVNVQWFGAIPNCYKGALFCEMPDVDPCHDEIQRAIDFCIAYGYDLYFPAGKRNEFGLHGGYLVRETLKIAAPNYTIVAEGVCKSVNYTASLNIYAEVDARITGEILDKSRPIFYIENCEQGKIENLTIQGCGYIPLAGIQFGADHPQKDSQAIELNNVRIVNCRHGVYSSNVETINRITLNRCVLVSNLIAGFYLKSHAEGGQGLGSGPITFLNTIMNGNGIPEFLIYRPETKDERGQTIPAYYPPKYKGIDVLNEGDKYGYQLYAEGFGNLSYFGGQLSAHGEPRVLSLATLENGFGINFSGVDIEDINYPVDETGARISDYDLDYGSIAGAAILVRNVRGFNLTQSHFFRINTQTVFRFVDKCGDVNIQATDMEHIATDLEPRSGNFKYSIDTQHSNWRTGIDFITRLNYSGVKDKLSTEAFNALDRSGMDVLTSIKGPIVPGTMNSIFSHFPTPLIGSKYRVGYNGTGTYNDPAEAGPYEDNINHNNALYIEKEIVFGTVFHSIIECTQNFNRSGLFFIQQVDKNGTVTANKSICLKGNGEIGYDTNYTYYNYLTEKLEPTTVKIRYGFINNNVNTGYIPDDITVKGLTAYIDYNHPIQKRRPIDMDF